jgi:hypothetical protein
MALGGLPRIIDDGDAAWLGLGVVLLGVEADLVAVRVVQQRKDPADAGPVHAGVLLACPVRRAASMSIASLSGTPMAK